MDGSYKCVYSIYLKVDEKFNSEYMLAALKVLLSKLFSANLNERNVNGKHINRNEDTIVKSNSLPAVSGRLLQLSKRQQKAGTQ
jgi:hypothetical protein